MELLLTELVSGSWDWEMLSQKMCFKNLQGFIFRYKSGD